MRVAINRHEFDTLESNTLAWACIEPVIQQIYAKDFTVKAQVYAQLTVGQRALLMFKMLHGHTNYGVTEFFDLIPHLPGQSQVWGELQSGMVYFGDEAMLHLLQKMEQVYHALKTGKQHADDLEFRAAVESLNERYFEVAPLTLKRIGAFIRNNPHEFVQIED